MNVLKESIKFDFLSDQAPDHTDWLDLTDYQLNFILSILISTVSRLKASNLKVSLRPSIKVKIEEAIIKWAESNS